MSVAALKTPPAAAEAGPHLTGKPAIIVTQQMLNRWYELQQQLEKIKLEEMEMRKIIFDGYFKMPKEGVNNAPLTAGWVLKGTYVMNRKVLPEVLSAKTTELREHGIPLEKIIKWEPKLSVSEYKKLDEKQRLEVDAVLEIKPGSPQLEIVLPKK